jgi:hypothetical protein
MNVSADQRNIPPNQPISEAGDERPAKGQNTAPRAREISADIRGSNIIIGKRERRPYNAQAMAFDASNIPMVPFYSSFAVAWDPGGLSKVIAEDSLFDDQPYLSQYDMNMSKACAARRWPYKASVTWKACEISRAGTNECRPICQQLS